MDFEKFAATILQRDEKRDEQLIKRDDRLTKAVAELAAQMAQLVAITAVSEEQHRQHRESRNKTDATLEDHGKRIYSAEAQILLLSDHDKTSKKRWSDKDGFKNTVKATVVGGLILAALVAYFGLS